MYILEKLYESRELTAEIQPQSYPEPLRGLIISPLSISSSYQWEGMFELNKQSDLSKWVNKFKTLAGATQSLFVSLNQTIQLWTGGTLSPLSISLFIPNLANKPVDKAIKSFMEWANPEVNESSLEIKAPHNYSPDLKDLNKSTGLLRLRYSTYINSGFYFVLESYMINWSDKIYENDYPAYAEVQITLKPYRLLSKSEIKSMLV